MGEVLIVDDEAGLRDMLGVVLRRDGHRVHSTDSGTSAMALLAEHDIDVLLTDLRMDAMDGLELLRRCRQEHPQVFVIAMTAYAAWDTAVTAMRLGAYNFITKPFDNQALCACVRNACQAREHFLAAYSAGEGHAGIHLIGISPAIQQVQERIAQIATTDSTVLVLGESGVGKELVARAVHYASLRADGPLMRVNSGALAPSLLESELFGHQRGAFTGAIEQRRGLFALATGGTLFLDEVGDLAPETQTKILRVLECGEYLPVGGSQVERCDVRVVAATNKDLAAMVKAGTFREDLYYRLAVITVDLPPLRERPEDIPLLAGHLLARHAVRLRRGITGFSPQAIEALQAYSWPGNVRELDNRIQRGAALTGEGLIPLEQMFEDMADTATEMWRKIHIERRTDSPPSPALEPKGGTPDDRLLTEVAAGGRIDLPRHLEDCERRLVAAALEACDHNLTEAAGRLGLSFRQMRYKVRQLGLR